MSESREYRSIREYYDVSISGSTNPLRRRRPWFHLFAILLSIGIVVGLAASPHGKRVYLSQHVSPPHRFFEAQCERCHTASFHLVRRWLGDENARFEHACRSCHTNIAAVDHHPDSMAASLPQDCSVCHQEHRGDRSLLAVRDRHCVVCHRELETTRGPVFARHIPSFREHPEFRVRSDQPADATQHGVRQVAQWNAHASRWEDKSHLKFNHQYHLDPQGVPVPPSDPDYLAREGRVVLSCRDCHQPDRGGGMKPIVFEQHCQRCHQLNVAQDLLKPATRREDLPPGDRSEVVGLPHSDVETLRALLRERLIQSHLGDGKADAAGEPYRRVEARLRDILALLFGGDARSETEPHSASALAAAGIGQYCSTCHEVQQSTAKTPGWVVVPPRLPDRWFQHASFSHDSHETIRCQDCHYREIPDAGTLRNGAKEARADDSILASKSAKDVLMPSIHTCQVCHGAKSTRGSGAPDRCVTCHDYHRHGSADAPRELREYLED